MNHFKSLSIGSYPLLIMGCTAIAFGLTHFYFMDGSNTQIIQVVGHILLFPVFIFGEIMMRIGRNDLMQNVIVIFMVLLFTYSFIAICTNKIFEWRRADNQ